MDVSSDDEPLAAIKKKKVKKEKKMIKPDPAPSSADVKKRKRDSNASAGAAGKSPSAKKAKGEKALKKLDKAERLQFAMQAFLWWNAKDPPEGCQWLTMEHSGVSFPEEYVPHGVKMNYDGQPVDLTPLQEEA